MEEIKVDGKIVKWAVEEGLIDSVVDIDKLSNLDKRCIISSYKMEVLNESPKLITLYRNGQTTPEAKRYIISGKIIMRDKITWKKLELMEKL